MRTTVCILAIGGVILSGCSGAPDDQARSESTAAEVAEADGIGTAKSNLILATRTGFAWSQYVTGDAQLGTTWASNGFYDSVFLDQFGTGKYYVIFEGTASYAGNAQVVAYDDGNANRCKVADWFVENGNTKITVYCHNTSGALANTRFSVWYSEDFSGGMTGRAASAYLRSSYGDRSHTPSSSWSFNSAGGTNYVTRDSTGAYTVQLPALNSVNGDVLVTAFGTGSEFCKTVSWYTTSGAVTNVQIACFDKNGNLADSRFSLLYTAKLDHGGSAGYQHWERAFVWADQKSSSSYTPNTNYNWNSLTDSSSSNTAGRLSTGRYFVQYPSFAATEATNAIVTAYGPFTEPYYCKPEGWDPAGTGTQLVVNCYNTSGNKVNSTFTAAYTYDSSMAPCDVFCNGVCCG